MQFYARCSYGIKIRGWLQNTVIEAIFDFFSTFGAVLLLSRSMAGYGYVTLVTAISAKAVLPRTVGSYEIVLAIDKLFLHFPSKNQATYM